MGGYAESMRQANKPAKIKSDPNVPYAAIPHRVIDSPAFSDLSPSAVQVLLLLVRQLTKENNGHLQATRTWLSERGVGSNHTIQRAISGLIAHGFIYRTKSGSYGNGAARYAVTWLSLTKHREGLTHFEWFKPCAWREWSIENQLRNIGARNPTPKKKNPSEMLTNMSINETRLHTTSSKTAHMTDTKIAHVEYIPIDTSNLIHLNKHTKGVNVG
jgi:hypothetical protein